MVQQAVVCRPADLLDNEVEKLTSELIALAKEKNIRLADDLIDDVLTYALFPQIGLKFLENRDNPDAFEPVPTGNEVLNSQAAGPQAYTVEVNGKSLCRTSQ